jgi:hypothetical protein
VKNVGLSPEVYDFCSQYLRLIRQTAAGWQRSLIVLKENAGNWNITVDFEYANQPPMD